MINSYNYIIGYSLQFSEDITILLATVDQWSMIYLLQYKYDIEQTYSSTDCYKIIRLCKVYLVTMLNGEL